MRTNRSDVITQPSSDVYAEARRRMDALAKPTGALGRLEDLAAWVSACQGTCPPRPLDRVRAVILAGDHGVSRDGVSAYPREVTPVMVRAFVSGVAGANSLARQHDVALRVLDLGVDDDLDDLPAEVSVYHLGPSEPIDKADALTGSDCRQALRAGEVIAEDEISAGADLLIIGDMGIGNTTPAAALVGASFGLRAEEVVGRGTGVDGDRLQHKTEVIRTALDRIGQRAEDPFDRLAALGSADIAAGVGFLRTAARSGVPVLLDGVVSVAEACIAEDLEPGIVAWCVAGHRSTEPAQQFALDKLGLEPILDLGLRLGEGTGALTALPVLRSAVLLLRELALLADLSPAS
jgi:nicotinate-nucleotide--dimethylbenzimidazole phosphoribosyltransferase